MAKFAKVTYGSHGDTKQYTYIVNDSVQAGTVVYPVVTHYQSNKNFATMGIIQSTAKPFKKDGETLTKRGSDVLDEIEEANENRIAHNNSEPDPTKQRETIQGIKKIETGADLGIYKSSVAQRDKLGRIVKHEGTIPSKAMERSDVTGLRAITSDTSEHYSPSTDKYASKVMKAQLDNLTVYGFETFPRS